MNICSLIVHTKPLLGSKVSKHLQRFQGVEVHGGTEVNKLIVTIEDKGESISPISDTMTALREVEGVISTVLIYHYDVEE
jgi:nitrate reductase NapD